MQPKMAKCREEILDYINYMQPDFVKSFMESEPREVVDEIPETGKFYKNIPPSLF